MPYPNRIKNIFNAGLLGGYQLTKTTGIKEVVALPPVVPPVVIPISCDGATEVATVIMSEQFTDGSTLNHTDAVYRTTINNIDQGDIHWGDVQEHYFEGGVIGFYADSSGYGNFYGYTEGSFEGIVLRISLKPSETRDAANIYGVDTDSNPTLLYNEDTREITFCMFIPPSMVSNT